MRSNKIEKRKGNLRKAEAKGWPRQNEGLINLAIIAALLILPIISAYPGGYSDAAPLSCGSNCSGGYELFGNSEEYCDANRVECYNTNDTCKDGDDPSYEYVENITVTDLDHDYFIGKDRIVIDADLVCSEDGDEVNFVYSNGSGLKVVNSTTCYTDGTDRRSHHMEIEDVDGDHIIRVIIAYRGNLGMTCSEEADNIRWTDTDDLKLSVAFADEYSAPEVDGFLPATGANIEMEEELALNICINVTDDSEIRTTTGTITWSTGSQNLTLEEEAGDSYCSYFTVPDHLGTYNVSFYVEDEYKNVNDTESSYFNIIQTGDLTLLQPIYAETLPYGTTPINFSTPGEYNVTAVYLELDEEGSQYIGFSRKNVSFTSADANGSFGENTYENNLSMSLNMPESLNVTARQISLSMRRISAGGGNITLELKNDSGGSPGQTLAIAMQTNDSVWTSFSYVNFSLNQTVNLMEGGSYWIVLNASESNSTDFYEWEASDDETYSDGEAGHNASIDLLFIVYDAYEYRGTLTGLAKGTHDIIIHSETQESTLLSSPPVRFYIDVEGPSIDSYNYTPNTASGLDPMTMINFTFNITDDYGVKNVTLRYRISNESVNYTLNVTKNGNTYTSPFTAITDGTYIFYVTASDYSENNASQQITLNISYDYGWEMSPSLLNITSGIINTNKSISNITLTNNADFTLTFNVSKTSSTIPLVFINGSETNKTFSILPGGNVTFGLIVTAQSIESEQNITVIVDETSAYGTPGSRELSFMLVSIVSGPYLDIEIITYDMTVDLGQERILLVSRLVNLGNQTATNATVAYGLPAGWSSSTSFIQLNQTYQTIGVGQEIYFERYVNVGATSATGTVYINATVNSTEGKNSTDIKAITVNSEEEAPPVVINRGGGGGSSGGGMIPEPEARLEMTLPNETEVERGGNVTIRGTIKNAGERDLKNITLLLEGFSLVHQNITPSSMDLKKNETARFEIALDAPTYLGGQKLRLVLRARTSSGSEFTKETYLIVLSEDKNDTIACIYEASDAIYSLRTAGIQTQKIAISLTEVKRAYKDKEYSQANLLCQEIIERVQKALLLKQRLEVLKELPFRKDVPELDELVKLGEDSFENENYDLAERRIEQAELLAGIKERELEQTIIYRLEWVRTHAKEITLWIIMLVVISVFAGASFRMRDIDRMMRTLDIDEEIVRKKINETQRRYFAGRKMPVRLYNKEMDHHRNKLSEIEVKRNSLKIKRLHIISNLSLEDLEKRRKETEEGRRGLQREYYIKKSIDKTSYHKLNQGYDKIILDITKEIENKR
ncbi:hypothetical protein JW826_05190 [Candidatus Woesearchaeota archaeon]|nr:hypothetical protein [Candidatus Woesearchaeota archaeon]